MPRCPVRPHFNPFQTDPAFSPISNRPSIFTNFKQTRWEIPGVLCHKRHSPYYKVLILFAGQPCTTNALLAYKGSNIPVAVQLGGCLTFDIDGAVQSQCKTHKALVVACFNGATMEGICPEFQNRISGSCDHIKLKDVQKGDLNHRFICENLDPLKPASYTYIIKATTAPPQNVSLSINGSKVSVFWQPPPAHWQAGPILEYEVMWSCNGSELLMNKTTVAGTSAVLEGLPQGVRCTVSVAAISSNGVEAWSEPKPVVLLPSDSSDETASGERYYLVFIILPFLTMLLTIGLLYRRYYIRKRMDPPPAVI